MEQNIIIKGTMQKNKPALITIIAGAVLILISFIVASNEYQNSGRYVYGYGFREWWLTYDSTVEYFIEELFSSFHGVIFLLGVVMLIVGVVMKAKTEKCEITVTSAAIIGKLSNGKEVHVPLNQITAIKSKAFNGVSVISIGKVSNFYCIENRDEVTKAIAYLLTNSQQRNAQTTKVEYTPNTNCGDIERLKDLKELFDSGVLTQEEYAAKKKEIIDL